MKKNIWDADSLIDKDTLDSLSKSELKQVADIFNRAERHGATYLMDGSIDTGEEATEEELLDTVAGDTYFRVQEVKKWRILKRLILELIQ